MRLIELQQILSYTTLSIGEFYCLFKAINFFLSNINNTVLIFTDKASYGKTNSWYVNLMC